VVVSAGASVTAATLSADWVGKLRDRLDQDGYEFVNAGINGNTSADLLRRLDSDLIACQPDAVTLLVGTNDVRDGVPLARYREDLNTILDRLRAGMSARIAVLSLPPLGEDLDGAMNQRLTGYNDVIKELAEAPGVADLPLHERLVDLIRQHGDGQPYDFSFGRSYGAALDHYVFGKSWDEIADGNGLRVLTDHVHLSDRGGAVVAELVADWLCTAR
jgi:lysophospholipase L1-like esterase